MALTALEQNTVIRGLQIAKKVIEELKPAVDALNIIYDAEGGVKTTLTQEDLDGVAIFSGLTKAQLDDGMYVLTAVLKTDISNGFTQLIQLAARAGL